MLPVLSRFSCVQFFATLDCSLPGSSGYGILQTRILQWVAILFSRGSSRPMKPTSLMSPALAGGFFTTSATWEAQFSHYKIFNTKSGLKFLEWKKKITRNYWRLIYWRLSFHRASQVALVVKNPPASAGDITDAGSIPGSGRSPGGGFVNPLQYSGLENLHGQKSLMGYSP